MTIRPKNERIRADIDSALEVTAYLRPFLLPGGEAPDEEVATSAEATFINACNKLDKLLEILGTDIVETQIEKEIIDNSRAASEARKQESLTQRTLRRPSVLFHPQIVRTHGGWLAFYGDLHASEDCVIGLGASVEEAMADFDREWFLHAKDQKNVVQQTTETPKTNTKSKRGKRKN